MWGGPGSAPALSYGNRSEIDGRDGEPLFSVFTPGGRGGEGRRFGWKEQDIIKVRPEHET